MEVILFVALVLIVLFGVKVKFRKPEKRRPLKVYGYGPPTSYPDDKIYCEATIKEDKKVVSQLSKLKPTI